LHLFYSSCHKTFARSLQKPSKKASRVKHELM
jgi:hypothetical protein